MERISMAEGLNGIITQLERQKLAIDKALAALREIGGVDELATEVPTPDAPATRKRGMSPEGKKRLIAALKKRWAAKKAAQNAAPVTAPLSNPPKTAPRKVRFTQDGRRRLAEAMRKRWAVKRAASAVNNTARNKRAAK